MLDAVSMSLRVDEQTLLRDCLWVCVMLQLMMAEMRRQWRGQAHPPGTLQWLVLGLHLLRAAAAAGQHSP